VIENAGVAGIRAPSMVERLDALINERTVSGPRSNVVTQQEIDSF
jgi:hypothetical protein